MRINYNALLEYVLGVHTLSHFHTFTLSFFLPVAHRAAVFGLCRRSVLFTHNIHDVDQSTCMYVLVTTPPPLVSSHQSIPN